MDKENFNNLSCYDDLIVCVRSLEDLFLLMNAVDRKEERLVYACSEIGMLLTVKFRELLEQTRQYNQPIVTSTSSES